MRNDIEVNLKEMMIWVIKQWKKMIAVAGFFAIILNFAVSIVEYNTPTVSNENIEVDWTSVLSEDEIRETELTAATYLETVKNITNIKAYVDNSIRYKIDANNVSLHRMNYAIRVLNSDEIVEMVALYDNAIYSENMCNNIREKLSWNISDSYILELINTYKTMPDKNSEEIGSFVLTVEVMGMNKEDCTNIAEEINDMMDIISNQLEVTYPGTEVELIGQSDSIEISTTLLNHKSTVLGYLNNLNSYKGIVNTNLSSQQMEYFSKLISGEEEENIVVQEERKFELINIKGIFLGAIFGIIVVVCYLIVIYLVDGKLRSSVELIARTEEKVIEVKDDNLLTIQLKAVLKNKEISSLYALSTIDSLKKIDVDKTILTNISIISMNENEDITKQILSAEETDGVILFEQKEKSKIKDIEKICDLCKIYNIPIIAIVVFE